VFPIGSQVILTFRHDPEVATGEVTVPSHVKDVEKVQVQTFPATSDTIFSNSRIAIRMLIGTKVDMAIVCKNVHLHRNRNSRNREIPTAILDFFDKIFLFHFPIRIPEKRWKLSGK